MTTIIFPMKLTLKVRKMIKDNIHPDLIASRLFLNKTYIRGKKVKLHTLISKCHELNQNFI